MGILFIAVKFLIRKNHIKLYSIYKNLELIIYIDNSIENKAYKVTGKKGIRFKTILSLVANKNRV
ncbi:unknown [Rickettsia conorii str. Malish 7]|uniref:Uncharacterized protein n=1 Tax=Rickettsia conorii (strain ATCC VR-613 / Malish 7) TaxID=272944 RepID=Q92H33_RICCN|nr:unknown [Rickettsia conorii str. Malish 7]